jgi:chemotaxis protein MotB
MPRATLVLLAACLSLPSGCIRKAEHEAALRDLSVAHNALEYLRPEVSMLRRQVGEKGARVLELEAAVRAQQQRVAELATSKAQLQQDLWNAKADLDALDARARLAERALAELVKRKAGLKASMERMTQALEDLGARQLEAEKRVAEYKDMLARFRTLIDAGKLDIHVVDGRMVLTMPMDILFDTGSAKLSAEGKASLVDVGAVLAPITDKRYQVEGHTDDVPIHNERYVSNWELAAERALVVVHTLVDAGVASSQLSAASYGEFQPRASNAEESGRATNRRIEIVVLPDLGGLPGAAELEQLDGATGAQPSP